MTSIMNHLRRITPKELATKQLAIAQLELLTAQQAFEAWEFEVKKLQKRVDRLKREVDSK